MIVREAMRPTCPVPQEATLADVLEAIQSSGSEVVPIIGGANGRPVVRQLVGVRDLPKLNELAGLGQRGHALGHTVLDLLALLGRQPSSLPTIGPRATLVDAWGIMSEECMIHLPVIDQGEAIGMISLMVTWSEFPHRSPTAGFLA